jgi:hypothetical protein
MAGVVRGVASLAGDCGEDGCFAVGIFRGIGVGSVAPPHPFVVGSAKSHIAAEDVRAV